MAAGVGERPARSSRAAMTWTELPRGRSDSKCPHAPPISPDVVLPGWLEVEGESNMWGPHVSEWRERSSRGCFGPYGRCVHVYGLTVGPDTRKT